MTDSTFKNSLLHFAATRGVDITGSAIKWDTTLIGTTQPEGLDAADRERVDDSIRTYLEAIEQPFYQPYHRRHLRANDNDFWISTPTGIALADFLWKLHRDSLIAPSEAATILFADRDFIDIRNAATLIAYYCTSNGVLRRKHNQTPLRALYRTPAAYGTLIPNIDGKAYKGGWCVLRFEVEKLAEAQPAPSQ